MTNRCMSAQEIIDICVRDHAFYKNSKGGITLGGGDPLFQSGFARKILELAKENTLNTSIETSACATEKDFFSVIELCDTIHIDIKAVDSHIHSKITGIANAKILKNIRAYDRRAIKSGRLIFRIPLIPGYTAGMENIRAIGQFVASLDGAYPIEILPFHNFGGSKYEQLCLPYTLEDMDNMKKSEAAPYAEFLADMGLSVTINTH